MAEYYDYLKSLHLIFVITWFAGLFYIPRLFIYHIEANSKPKDQKEILIEQFKIMTKRLWLIITWPSAILATGFGIALFVLHPFLLEEKYMRVKLIFVFLLILYHIKTHLIYKELQNDKINYSSNFMRYWNEGATIILFSVVFLITLKSATSWIFGVLGIISLSLFLTLGIKLYKKARNE
jgi:putative membrane protein